MTNRSLHQIAETRGRIRCETPGVELFLQGDDLVVVDTETGVEQVTIADAEELAREEAQRNQAEAQRNQVEAHRKQEQELQARVIADRRVRELEEKIRRLESGN